MKKFLLFIAFAMFTATAFGQKIRVTSGKIDALAQEKEVGVTFSYDNMQVGKLREIDYVARKTEEYNKKEPGRGDEWSKAWIADRKERFEPKFLELFAQYIAESKSGGFKLIQGGEPRYTMAVNTDFSEPGFNVGVMRQNASITLGIDIIETATGTKVARILVENASANSFWGMDFETGYRIQECYAKAGRELAKYLIKNLKL